MELVPRAGAIRDTRGVIKMVADADTNEVLGVAMLGPSAAEVIHEAALGLRFHATIDDFIDLLHVYPTMTEALKIVAIRATRTRPGFPAAPNRRVNRAARRGTGAWPPAATESTTMRLLLRAPGEGDACWHWSDPLSTGRCCGCC
jgi:hypothetical protein